MEDFSYLDEESPIPTLDDYVDDRVNPYYHEEESDSV